MNTITITITIILAAAAISAAATASFSGDGRARTAEAALRRIVEAQALAMWANTSADHETYERLANDRDDAIEAALVLVEGDR